VLWDFGGPSAVALPDAEPMEPPPSSAALAAMLFEMWGYSWRRKRAYERRHGLD
jgi:hypothetical protein